jgi:hypothetical protein
MNPQAQVDPDSYKTPSAQFENSKKGDVVYWLNVATVLVYNAPEAGNTVIEGISLC